MDTVPYSRLTLLTSRCNSALYASNRLAMLRASPITAGALASSPWYCGSSTEFGRNVASAATALLATTTIATTPQMAICRMSR